MTHRVCWRNLLEALVSIAKRRHDTDTLTILSPGPDAPLLPEDEDALSVVLPGGELFDTEFAFYVHISSLFKVSLQVHHEVLFSQLALSVVPEDVDCTDVWHNVIKGNIELRLYDEAYAALMTTPYDKLCVD